MGSELVKPHHLGRRAVVYVRQSSPHQVLTNQESLRLQYALRQKARELGWRETDIDVIDPTRAERRVGRPAPGLQGPGRARNPPWRGRPDLSTEVTRLAATLGLVPSRGRSGALGE